MKKTPILFLAVIMSVQFSGCATVVSGSNQDVMIRSKPTGSSVLIDSMIAGTTPMLANLARKKRHTIEITSPDGTVVTRGTTKGFNWWYLGNIILGGIIGLIVDPITGAMFDVNPEAVYVDFERPEQVFEAEDIKSAETPEIDIEKTD